METNGVPSDYSGVDVQERHILGKIKALSGKEFNE